MPKPLLNQLRWKVTVRTPSASGNTITWANTAVFAGIETMSAGPEGQIAGQVTGQVNYLLLFRNEVAVTANSQVVWNGKTIRIQSVRMLNPMYVQALGVEKQ